MRRTLFTVLSAIALVATGVVGAIAVGGTGTVDPPPKIAFLANGIVPADALAAGGIAGQLGAPLFTTRAETLNDDARDGIEAYAPELVIALGGPVAINDSVLDALATATGLARTAAENPTSGIVRVAGGDRFATARAVADLLAAYDPAYLPVDATALGAVDADTLDGKDSTEFALSDQACDPGEVVTEIDADGELLCTPDQDEIDGGDADTLDGLDSTDFVALSGGLSLTATHYTTNAGVGGGSVGYYANAAALISDAPGDVLVQVYAPTPTNILGASAVLESVDYCYGHYAGWTINEVRVDGWSHEAGDFGVQETYATDGTDRTDIDCQTLVLDTPEPVDLFETIYFSMDVTTTGTGPGLNISPVIFNYTTGDGGARSSTAGVSQGTDDPRARSGPRPDED